MSKAENPSYINRNPEDRLNPKQCSRIYWPLTELKRVLIDILSKYKSQIKNAIVLDYGCGNSPYRPLLEKAGIKDYLTADLPGNDKAGLILGKNGAIPCPDAQMDVVLSSQVLEHVADPQKYLSECHRVLKENGILILSTPAIWRYHPDPEDFWRWTSAGLKKILENHGFILLDCTGAVGIPAVSIRLWQDSVQFLIPEKTRPILFYMLQKLMALIDKRTPQVNKDKDASFYTAVAVKKKDS